MSTRWVKALSLMLVLMVGGASRADVQVKGAGATFPQALYTKWFADYGKKHADVKFDYQGIGSGRGIKFISEKQVDFGASDIPMTDDQLNDAPGIAHVPMVMGAVAVVYHLTGIKDLHLSSDVLAKIFLGKIDKWNDPAIAALNPKIKLPELTITIVHRSDDSGTTAVFTEYLSKVAPEWRAGPGSGVSVTWPASSIEAKGNDGIAEVISQSEASVSYVDLSVAHKKDLTTALLQNRSGEWIAPSLKSVSAAAEGFALPGDFRSSITNSAAKGAYPITSFTYILVYKDTPDAAKGKALINFLWWTMHEGQKTASGLDYAPLPSSVVKLNELQLKSLTAAGAPVLK
jgi:phosphate transport system substrate-binding protein